MEAGKEERREGGEKGRRREKSQRRARGLSLFMAGKNSCCAKITMLSYRAVGLCVYACVVYICVCLCVCEERRGQTRAGMEGGREELVIVCLVRG